MTTDTGQAPPTHEDVDTSRMPPGVRRVALGVIAMMLGFATYLFAVRGTAIVYDIGQFGAKLMCL